MSSDYFTSKWIMTLFACFLPYSLEVFVLDNFIIDSWPSIFKIGIAYL
jgi:hypothetical protein